MSKVSKSNFDSFNEQEQMAFLINAYNAFTLKLIIDNYPVKSIKDSPEIKEALESVFLSDLLQWKQKQLFDNQVVRKQKAFKI